MSTRLPAASQVPKSAVSPVQGLPKINYGLPVVVTLVAAIFSFLVLLGLTLLSLFNVITQWGRIAQNMPGSSVVGTVLCGGLGLLCLMGTVYLFVAIIRGARDVVTPVYYTRGSVADKQVLGGRKTGNWLGVYPRYSGPHLAEASFITDDQRSASPDRSTIVQPRFGSDFRPPTASSYLPADRIAAVQDELAGKRRLRVVFRTDPASLEVLKPGDEVLLAHSRYLQHIFYVAHLRGGEWESYVNKTLI